MGRDRAVRVVPRRGTQGAVEARHVEGALCAPCPAGAQVAARPGRHVRTRASVPAVRSGAQEGRVRTDTWAKGAARGVPRRGTSWVKTS